MSNFIFSCQDEDCFSTYNNHLLVSFYEPEIQEDGDIEYVDKDTVFYEVIALENDSVLYDMDTTISTLTLPVNPAANLTTFELYTIDYISRDTISYDPLEVEVTYHPNPEPHIIEVSYRSVTKVISEECGVEIGFVDVNVEDITFPDYESVSDNLSRFNLSNEEPNIKVYF